VITQYTAQLFHSARHTKLFVSHYMSKLTAKQLRSLHAVMLWCT